MKKKMLQKKLLISSIVTIVLICIVFYFFMPLPFISALWEENIARERMAGDVSQRVSGLHREDVIAMLGLSEETERGRVSFDFAFQYKIDQRRCLMILFGEDDMVVHTVIVDTFLLYKYYPLHPLPSYLRDFQ